MPTDGVASGEPITRAGRFSHEAVSLDPKHGVLYETEDDFQIPSGFFRYLPATNPVEAGRIDTISYGEQRPLEAGHDELSWAINRRAHFVVRGR